MAAIPLLQNQVVDLNGWLSQTEFTDLIAISEMTPGPIAINSAIFVGTRLAGMGGALVSTLGCVIPSFIIVLLLSWLYRRYSELVVIKGALAGLRPAVAALLLSAGLSVLVMSFFGTDQSAWNAIPVDFIAVVLFTAGLILLRNFKTNPIIVMLGSGVIGGSCYLLFY